MSINELERFTDQIIESPAARARLLASTLELLEENGADLSTPAFAGLLRADISNRNNFLSSMAASTVVIVIASGRQASAALDPSNVASTVVLAIASAGGRATAVDPSNVASTVVIAIASAGGRATAVDPSNVASTVVIAIASAGGRNAGFDQGILQLPSMQQIALVARGLRELADMIEENQQQLGQELNVAVGQLSELFAGGPKDDGSEGETEMATGQPEVSTPVQTRGGRKRS